MSDIKFNTLQFCPMFWQVRHHLTDESIRFIYAFGGSSASKTYSIVQALLMQCLEHKSNSMVLRKYGSDILDSIYSDFKGVIEDWGLHDQFICQQNLIKCYNGSYIRFRGMDDSEKIKGIARFTFIVMEEFNQFDQEDFKQVRKRMRGIPNQKILAIWNPVDELHWIKKRLDTEEWFDYTPLPIDDADSDLYKTIPQKSNVPEDKGKIAECKINTNGNGVLLRTNHIDNWYISGHPDGKSGYKDIHTLEDFEWDKANDYENYRIYGLGLWGRADKGGEYYKDFAPNRHIESDKICQHTDSLPLHISTDENVNPYITMTLWQALGKTAWQFDEITLAHPRNNLRDLANELYKKYPPTRMKTVYLYGDSTSRKRDTKLERGQNFFTILKSYLEQHGYVVTIKVPQANPSQFSRNGFINRIFSHRGYNDISLKFASSCHETIKDYLYVKEDSDGRKFKKKILNKTTNVRYEEYGHTSDANDYFMCEYFRRDFIQYEKGSKRGVARIVKRRDKTIY